MVATSTPLASMIFTVVIILDDCTVTLLMAGLGNNFRLPNEIRAIPPWCVVSTTCVVSSHNIGNGLSSSLSPSLIVLPLKAELFVAYLYALKQAFPKGFVP